MAELTEEDIKNMSPEQLMELQKQQCTFCKIAKGEIPSKKVYEDDSCVAVLDINPANVGHMLLLTKEHYQIMPQIPEKEIIHLAAVSKQLSRAALKTFSAQGTNVFIANGAVAGQRAPHFMIHIIPRMEKDDISLNIPENKLDEKEIENVQKLLSSKPAGEKSKKSTKKK